MRSFPRYCALLLSLILACAVLCAGGCGGVDSSIQTAEEPDKVVVISELSPEQQAAMRAEVARGIRQGLRPPPPEEDRADQGRYRLAPGDRIEVMYHVTFNSQVETYRVDVNDELTIEFFYQPELNRTTVVRPDGKISLPLKGAFEVTGKTPDEIAREIAEAYGDIYQDPRVTITVNKFSSKVLELQEAITNSMTGQSKLIAISPDGYIYLPMLEPVWAAGKTLSALRAEINDLYRRDFSNLRISLLLEATVGNTVYVLGEVKNPGGFKIDGAITTLQAVARAGGVTDKGSLGDVRVLSVAPDNTVVLRRINLERVITEMRLEEDTLLERGSVVYVPMTGVARFGKALDQYLYNIIKWNGSSFFMSLEEINL